jgi:hypothetical protein
MTSSHATDTKRHTSVGTNYESILAAFEINWMSQSTYRYEIIRPFNSGTPMWRRFNSGSIAVWGLVALCLSQPLCPYSTCPLIRLQACIYVPCDTDHSSCKTSPTQPSSSSSFASTRRGQRHVSLQSTSSVKLGNADSRDGVAGRCVVILHPIHKRAEVQHPLHK